MRYSFFQSIKYYYGYQAVKGFKHWIKYNKVLIRCNLKIEFLRKCIRHEIMPSHISNILTNFEKTLFNYRSIGKYKHCKLRFSKQLLHIELMDIYRYGKFASTQIFKISNSLYRCVPLPVCNSFFNRQSRPLHSFFNKHRFRMRRKFDRLISRVNDQAKNIPPIKYYCQLPPSHEIVQYSFKPPQNLDNQSVVEIEIKPGLFRDAQSPFDRINDKWFINLSSTVIPNDIQSLLQLGDNFSLPTSNTDILTMEFIKSIENNLKKFPLATQANVRNRLIHIVDNIPNYIIPNNNFNNKIQKLLALTKKFLHDNNNLILTRADKGNVTVALDRDKYISEIETLLSDGDTYAAVNRDPTKKLIVSSRELLTRWTKLKFITGSTQKSLYCSDGVLPRAYGLPKIHKPNCPFRLIVSYVNSPLYGLASFLHRIMLKSFPVAPSHVNNSFDLVKDLTNIYVNNGFKLISLDVISLFTNIPIEMVLDSISLRWNYIAAKCEIPKSEFFIAVRLILNSTFFIFNGRIYRQTFGVPMGSPLSPISADIVLQDLERKALSILRFTPAFYRRYIDDVALAAPSALLQHTLNVFNSFHPRLQFTIEVGEDDTLNFLEITIILKSNLLMFDWYHKPTFSGRYLNFLSQHPTCQKRGTVISLIDRVISLSHPSFHEKNLSLVIEILLKNCYPLSFIFGVLRNRLKFLFNRDTSVNDTRDEGEVLPFFTIPYIPKITEQFKTITRDIKVRLSYNSLNKMRSIIKSQKDMLPRTKHCNVVYKINCNDCECSYVGQTSRQLQTRIKEHQNHINWNTSNHSVITDHRRAFNHNFNWDNVKILDKEAYYYKRLISEMLYIKRQGQGLNLQMDIEGLPTTYLNVINKLSKM